MLLLLGAATCGQAISRDCAVIDAASEGGLGAGSRIRVLWVGNSLTDTPPDIGDYRAGALPVRLAPMLAELGIRLESETRLQGGANFSDHARNPQTLAALASGRHDAVNLQGYYEGYASADAFRAAVQPLVDAARKGQATPLFQQVWTFRGDPGSPQFPAAALAVEEAARRIPGALPVQIMRVWHAASQNVALAEKLYADNTHQSAVGEYLTALAYARFLSGRSVRDIVSIHPRAAARLSVAERRALKEAVDSQVSIFYRRTPALC